MLEYVSSEDAAVQQQLIETPAAEFRSVTSVAPGYVVAMLGGVLVVVDLKRAQERLLYEYYLLMLTNGSAVSEQLLFPERLVLSHDEYELLGQYAAEFAAVGFDIERVGDGAIDVKGTPADMPSDTIDELIYQLLQTFAHVSAADLRRQRIAAELARSGRVPWGAVLRRRRPSGCSNDCRRRATAVSRLRGSRFWPKSRSTSCVRNFGRICAVCGKNATFVNE